MSAHKQPSDASVAFVYGVFSGITIVLILVACT